MLLLVVVSVWIASLVAVGSAALSDESVGTLPQLSEDSDKVSFFGSLQGDAGRVAGVVDESSPAEDELRNDAAAWLGDVREVQSLSIAYRDGVLDRNAQNQARYLAERCSTTEYSEWQESIGMRVDEGYTTSFSESIFTVSGVRFAQELPNGEVDYSRLFTNYDAVGLGVAEFPDTQDCGEDGYVMVFHVAEVQ